jgi:hypothetical protein
MPFIILSYYYAHILDEQDFYFLLLFSISYESGFF